MATMTTKVISKNGQPSSGGGEEIKITTEAMSREMQSSPWRTIGEKNTAPSNRGNGKLNMLCAATSNRERIVDQITSILEHRIDALLAHRAVEKGDVNSEAKKIHIAGTAAQTQLRAYVSRIVSMYRDVRYHNAEHAAHVTLSLNKMVEMLNAGDKNDPDQDFDNDSAANNRENLDFHASDSFINYDAGFDTRTVSVGHHCSYNDDNESGRRTFGISSDPLAQLAVVFSALVHDVDHTGVSNRQLILEGDELAILYNDQSMAEQHSLKVAFSVLLGPDFGELQKAMFPTGDDKFRFRKIVIDMLLCTDIGSPERIHIGKSKWREAFEIEDPPIVPVMPEDSVYGNKSSGDLASLSSLQRSSRTLKRSSCSGRRHSLDCELPFKFISEDKTTTSVPHRLSFRSNIHLNDATIEFYPRESINGANKLRANVVLEQIMQAADVAHTMQSWETFVKWNSRLYAELYDAYTQGRGEDPSTNWYAGQIAFYDKYVLPLAERLDDCGAFGEVNSKSEHGRNMEGGNTFLQLAQENRRRWVLEGMAVTDLLVKLAEDRDNFEGFTSETLSCLSGDNSSSFAFSLEGNEDLADVVKSGRGGVLPLPIANQFGARTA